MAGWQVLVLLSCFCAVVVQGFLYDYAYEHVTFSANGETPQDWRKQAKEDLFKRLNLQNNVGVAKNVILFIGDGMSVPTITASRILKGQMQGKTGEETVLSFENLPYTGLSKTYSQDFATPDSASTATAFLSGVKTNLATVGLDARVTYQDCASTKDAKLTTIIDWSLAEGKSVGIVTTTRVTDATPAAAYAHSPDRFWEGDTSFPPGGQHGNCTDIASQLIDDNPQIQVIMGGGRQFFMRYDQLDPEVGSNTEHGRRDGRDLLQEWKTGQQKMGRTAKYVWNSRDFSNVDPATTDSLLGLFSNTHMNYELYRNDSTHEVAGEPSLKEMMEKAVQILSKNPKGYFLLVEGGNIDHGHHYGSAKLAMYDTLALEAAVAKGDEMTNEKDTLIVVTSDHSHTMSIAGYPTRGNPILGKADVPVWMGGGSALGDDGLPYTTLMYSNGPGYNISSDGHRANLTGVDTTADQYLQQAAVPLALETHAGDDVAIFTRGPMSHLLTGVHEQHYIAHVMAYASCVGDYSHHDDCAASFGK